MTAERHADAVRSYLNYLCHRAEITDADGWRDWVRRVLAGSATVGLSIGMLSSACAPENGLSDGTGGEPTGGRATGGWGTGGVVPGSGGAYGLPTGGTASGGVAAGGRWTGGAPGSGGKYGVPFPTGGRGTGGFMYTTGGAVAGGSASGGAGGNGVRYGLPMGGSSG
jgi:hypothetical protein